MGPAGAGVEQQRQPDRCRVDGTRRWSDAVLGRLHRAQQGQRV